MKAFPPLQPRISSTKNRLIRQLTDPP